MAAKEAKAKVIRVESNLLAILFALASALTIAWGTVVRHRVVLATPPGDMVLSTALRTPIWWAGLATALTGYGFQIIALAFGALLVVQPVLVLSLMFTMLLASRMEHRTPTRSESLWATFLSAAVATLLIVGRPEQTKHEPAWAAWVAAFCIGALGMILLTLAAGRAASRRRALLLGLVTGALFGYVAVLSKAFVTIWITEGFISMLSSWQAYALIAGATVGTIVQQYSFNAGPLSQSLPAMTVSEPIIALILGYVVLGERLALNSWLGTAIIAIALVAMIVSTWMLSATRQ